MGPTRRSLSTIGFVLLIAACSSGGNGAPGAGGSGKEGGATGNPSGGTSGGPKAGASGTPAAGASGSASAGAPGTSMAGTTGNPAGGSTNGAAGSSGSGGTTVATAGTASGGAAAGQAGASHAGGAGGGVAGGAGGGGGVVSGCVGGKAWPTANPTAAGPFEVAADKGVGPLAGYTPDPIYGDQQQRFNIYRPKNLANSGYCHPILVWANGHTDNPEPNAPLCVVDSGANKWCGQYLPLMNHLASHGFVVIASLSTTTSMGNPLPTIAGLNWLLQQAEDSSSAYYHRLDTANIGQLGHSEGGMSTCMVASEPRYKALASICGTRALTGVHTPMLFFCGGKDTRVPCDGVRDVFLTVKDQPAFFINELNADHGSWVYQGAKGVSLSVAAAWFRVHLMGDTANRKYFYGPSCTFCTDNRVKVEQNSLMTQ
ncbi:MAG TPA: hypothetical protein VER12_04585 [Polyangiaceae bacterium]|nr:hypothetical protein [Polyangiaceae bacterium]